MNSGNKRKRLLLLPSRTCIESQIIGGIVSKKYKKSQNERFAFVVARAGQKRIPVQSRRL